MRDPWRTLLLGVVVACGGERFSSSVNASAGSANVGGTGGATVPTGPTTGGAGGAAGTAAPVPATEGGRAPGAAGETADAGEGGALAAAGAPPGDDGGASSEPACPSRSGGDWSLGFYPELREASTVETHPFFQISNRGASATPLSRIQVRYYFTRESNAAETGVCYWVTGDRCALVSMKFADVAGPTPVASRYLEVSFPSASGVMVSPGQLEVRVGFKAGSSPMLQSNDYSFDPSPLSPSAKAPFPYKSWTRATLYVGGELVWGEEPCAGAQPP